MSREEAVSDDFELHEAITRAGTIVMERLYKLARKGYKPDFDMEFTESIWLRHPSLQDCWPHNTMILYPHGLLISLHSKNDEYRFESWEKEEFERFLKMIPKPTLTDRTRDFRSWVAAWVFIGIFVGGFAIGAGWVVRHITRAFGSPD